MTRRECLFLAPGLAVSPQASKPLRGALLSNTAWPRPTTLREWTSDVMRISRLEKATETTRGKAFFEWVRLFSRMAVGGMIQAYEGAYGKEQYVTDPHKTLFVYGWGYCDTSSRIAEAAWQEYTQDPASAERVVVQHDDGGYHTMYRLRMDGRHGAFDPRYGYYLIERDTADARILDWHELAADNNFQRNKSYRHRCRPYFEIAGVEWQRALLLHPAYFASEDQWRAAGAPKEHVFGNGAYSIGSTLHDMEFSIPSGAAMTRHWDNSACKFYAPAGKHTQREWPFLRSGRFYRVTENSHDRNWPRFDPNYHRANPNLFTVPSGEGYPEELTGGRTIGQAYGVIEYKTPIGREPHDFRCPYVLVDGTVDVQFPDSGGSVEIRTLAPKPRLASEPDLWSPWQTILSGPGRKSVEIGRPRFNGSDASIHGVYRFQLRSTAPGPLNVALKVYFENGIMTIPPLFQGENRLRFHLANPEDLSGAISISYDCETSRGRRTVRHQLTRNSFNGNQATFTMHAPDLLRCHSVTIASS